MHLNKTAKKLFKKKERKSLTAFDISQKSKFKSSHCDQGMQKLQ